MTKPRAVICSQSNFATDYRVEKMRQTLTQAGYDVTLLGRSHPREERVSTADTRYMRFLFWHGPLFYAELNFRMALRLIFGRRYDLVVSIDLDTLAGCQLASRLRGERLIFDSHELFPEVPEIADKPRVKKVWNAIQDYCVPRIKPTDVCVTVCQSIADIFKKKYGRDFLVIRNAPLAARAEMVAKARGRVLSDVAGDRPFTILYQGAVNVGRGVEEVIEAMTRLDGCKFLVVGDGDVLPKCKTLAQRLGVADKVEFVGRVPFERLAPYMASADVGVVLMRNTCLNHYFALPNRVFDFVSANLPIIANRVPEVERIVEGEDVGVCIDGFTSDDIASAISYVRSQPELTARWRHNMQQLAPRLTWEGEARQLIDLINPAAK